MREITLICLEQSCLAPTNKHPRLSSMSTNHPDWYVTLAVMMQVNRGYAMTVVDKQNQTGQCKYWPDTHSVYVALAHVTEGLPLLVEPASDMHKITCVDYAMNKTYEHEASTRQRALIMIERYYGVPRHRYWQTDLYTSVTRHITITPASNRFTRVDSGKPLVLEGLECVSIQI